MEPYSIAFVLYGDRDSKRDALSEEKYKGLAGAFLQAGFRVQSVLYSDEVEEQLFATLSGFDAVLVWVNPLEQGKDRRRLDKLLKNLADQGGIVSAHPEVILKMGTKEVLFRTRDMDWGSPTQLYCSYEEFQEQFPPSLQRSRVTVLKQYRGNGGQGVFKIVQEGNQVRVVPAQKETASQTLSWKEFFLQFQPYFLSGMLIEQEWNPHHRNGMVRCYLCSGKVVGFGYQEINALYEITTADGVFHLPPNPRYYFSENCGLFADLREVMETIWVPQLQQVLSIPSDLLPVIWDADFFINEANSPTAIEKYTLCEINVSCVSPFPPSAIPYIVKETLDRINKRKESRSDGF